MYIGLLLKKLTEYNLHNDHRENAITYLVEELKHKVKADDRKGQTVQINGQADTKNSRRNSVHDLGGSISDILH